MILGLSDLMFAGLVCLILGILLLVGKIIKFGLILTLIGLIIVYLTNVQITIRGIKV